MKYKIKKLAFRHERKKQELARRIELCEEYRRKIIFSTNILREAYNNGLIDETEYKKRLYSQFNGREPEDWVKYYNDYADFCRKEIARADAEASQWLTNISIIAIVIILALGTALFGRIYGPTGFAVLNEEGISAEENATAEAVTGINDPGFDFGPEDMEEKAEFDEGNIINVLEMEKKGVKLKIKGIGKENVKNIWYKKGVLHVDPVEIDEAEISIHHEPIKGIITPPRLYSREDSSMEFMPLTPYTKDNKTFNKIELTETDYRFNVEHFSEYNLTGGRNFSDLTQALFWVNGTNDLTLVVSGNDTYYNNSNPKYKTMNTSLFNTTGMVLGYNFENDVDTSITDYADLVNGTSYDMGHLPSETYIMQTAANISGIQDNRIDSNQNIPELSAGNYSFLIGGLKIYENTTAIYSKIFSVFAQLSPTTFAGTGLLGTVTSNTTYTLTFANTAAGGGTSGAVIRNLEFGTEYCIGGYINSSDGVTWTQSLYVIGVDGERYIEADTTYPAAGTANFYVGEAPTVVTVTPNMTIGSIAVYNQTLRNMRETDIRDWCYGRLNKYYGYGEENKGRVQLDVVKNATIADYSLDSNNQSNTNRYGIGIQNINTYSYNIINNEIRGYALLFGSLLGYKNNWLVKDNWFDRNAGVTTPLPIILGGLLNSTLEGNTFNNTEGSAMLYACDNVTIRNNNFTNINRSWYNVNNPFGALLLSIVYNASVYDNIFYNITNGSAITLAGLGAKTSITNITNNTFYHAEHYDPTYGYSGAIAFMSPAVGVNITLNNFYGDGINMTDSTNATFCSYGEGNFYHEGINSSWIPATDCGQANITRPAADTNYSASINATWRNQSSTHNMSYHLLYSLDGTAWTYIARVYSEVFYNWSIANLTHNYSYQFKVIPFDDNYNATNRIVTRFGILNFPPTPSAPVEYPPDPATYSPNQFYQFNVTWTDDVDILNVTIEHNFTGTLQNSSTNRNTNLFFYNLTDLKAASYTWKMIANDSAGNYNATDQYTYTVNKNLTATNLYINGSQDNATIIYLQGINITAITSAVNVTLYRNGTEVNASAATLAYYNDTLDAGLYNITALNPGNDNYSSSSETFWLTVNPAAAAKVEEGGHGKPIKKEEKKAEIISKDVRPNFLPVILFIGEAQSSYITINNTGNVNSTFRIVIEGLADLAVIDRDTISLAAGQSGKIMLDAFAPTTTMPGIYRGRVIVKGGASDDITHVVIEVKERKPPFDISLNIAPERKKAFIGGTIREKIDMSNMGFNGTPVDVELTLSITDLNNTVVYDSSKETLAVRTTLSITREHKLPSSMRPGKYILLSRITYPGASAEAYDTFEIMEEPHLEKAVSSGEITTPVKIIISLAAPLIFIALVILKIRFSSKSRKQHR